MRRVLLLLVAVGGFCCPAALAQSPNCSGAQSKKLFCLVPNQLGQVSTQFGLVGAALSQDIGTEVGDLPLASPSSGVIYKLDPKLNLPVPSDQTLGPILTQRPETVGRHKLYFAAVYQFFNFEGLDGLALKNLPIVTTTPPPPGAPVLGFDTSNRLDLKVHQTTGYFTFGLTSRVDVSVAVPFLDIQEKLTTTGTKVLVNSPVSTPSTPFSVLNAGSASGIGDVVLAAKGTLWKPTYGGLAVGVEVRVPTGDTLNFLGSGTTGVKPYLAFAYGKRVSVHANVGYQFNGNSQLVLTSSGGEGKLPNRLFYSEGVDWGATKWVTFVADVLSQRVFNVQRITLGTATMNSDTFPTAVTTKSSYNRSDGAAGFKLKPYRNLIITANVIIKMDQGGLRARFVPLGGISYTF
jgi:Putative MetA-pathway of phenol degradation